MLSAKMRLIEDRSGPSSMSVAGRCTGCCAGFCHCSWPIPATWRDLVAESQKAFQALYARMGIQLGPDDYAGESTYNACLNDVVAELTDKRLLVESDGTLCVFFDDVLGPDGSPVPLIVRKSDGGFGYPATDLATIRYRIQKLEVDQILYVVDARQSQHFQMVFATARRAGWLTDDVDAVHLSFGTVLGSDGKPFKTRSGGTVRLAGLLDDAVAKARSVIEEKDHGLEPAELEAVVEAAGIGAVKYADLSASRVKDYVFDIDRMMSLNGNTGVYLQYAHARIRSILRNAPADAGTVDPDQPLHPAERGLALLLDEFGSVTAQAAETHEPPHLAGYLYSVARKFTEFYDACPVLKAEPALRDNRLAMCQWAGGTLETGLGLLGITAPPRL